MSKPQGIINANQLNGVELSFNNILDSDAAWNVVSDFPDNVIVIGGSMLSRGLTIEGLRTTYFLHTPKSAVNDTTLQNA